MKTVPNFSAPEAILMAMAPAPHLWIRNLRPEMTWSLPTLKHEDMWEVRVGWEKKSCSKSCREACPVWGNFQQHRFRNKCLTVIHLYLNTYHLYMYKMCIYIYILYVHVKYTELFSGGHWFLLGNAFKQQTIETSWWISKTFNCFLPSSRFYKSVHVHCHTISF